MIKTSMATSQAMSVSLVWCTVGQLSHNVSASWLTCLILQKTYNHSQRSASHYIRCWSGSFPYDHNCCNRKGLPTSSSSVQPFWTTANRNCGVHSSQRQFTIVHLRYNHICLPTECSQVEQRSLSRKPPFSILSSTMLARHLLGVPMYRYVDSCPRWATTQNIWSNDMLRWSLCIHNEIPCSKSKSVLVLHGDKFHNGMDSCEL